MILKNRRYTPEEPTEDAKKIYIFCEGAKREKDYFKQFIGRDSRIDLIVYDLKDTEDNSASGLVSIANKSLEKYQKLEVDEVWIVLDTDTHGNPHRIEKLKEMREQCQAEGWQVAQSNPCFEVWLYYHFQAEKPELENMDVPKVWKDLLNDAIKGGFSSKRHFVLVKTAIENAQNVFQLDENGFPELATTEVHQLAQNILAIGNMQEKIDKLLQDMQE
ncbi:MAG: RloB domain-containing protein [Bacteroidetes bacterium]|nr:MAG: RloB domain-containing protein [Bacteroidota bacterium]